ncbi:MAG: adenosine deaminase [Spirochaetales bacterium]
MIDTLKALPKIELHEHLDGSVRLASILDLGSQDGVRLPSGNLEELRAILTPGPSSLETYLRAFSVTLSVLQTVASLERVARETVEDWHADGVVYGEVRFAPELHQERGLGRPQIVEAVLRGLEAGSRTTGVATGLILCTMRSGPPSLETVKLVRDYRNDGVVAFDIAGAEAPFRPSIHREAYEFAAENYLNTTCHAGEVTSPGYIREALLACRSLRIGHGTQLIQEWGPARSLPGSGSLTAWIRDRQIPLELCLTSNLQTKAVESAAAHPFGEFMQAGLAVCLCTDNRLVSDTTLTKELELAQTTFGLSIEHLKGVQQNAWNAAFCSPEVRKRIKEKVFS